MLNRLQRTRDNVAGPGRLETNGVNRRRSISGSSSHTY